MSGSETLKTRMIKPASFFQFFRALTLSWKALMSGVASIALTFIAFFISPQHYKNALLGIAAICILWAAYEVWGNRTKSASHSCTISDLPRPSLQNPTLLSFIRPVLCEAARQRSVR